MIKIHTVLISCLLLTGMAHAQQEYESKDLIDIIQQIFNKQKKSRDTGTRQGARNLSVLPLIGYAPANGFIIGGALSATQLLGNAATTNLSSALFNVSLTSKGQVLLNLRTNIYLRDNEWNIPGDIRFLFFSQPTYGLGIDRISPGKYSFSYNGFEGVSIPEQQPMRFNYIRLYETLVKEIAPFWYLGAGINIDYHFSIRDQSLSLTLPEPIITSHYLYSKKYGFDTAHYFTNGLSVQLMYDSRDNAVNTYKGSYAKINYRVNPEWLGSSRSSTMLYYDVRTYIGLQASRPRHLLALWSWGQFVTSGRAPYLALPSIGWDTYNRSGRGYIQGRFRGDQMVYAEAEYRFPISSNGLLGGAAFANGTSARNPVNGQELFQSIATGFGLGLRLKMNKKDRSNICVDIGFGQDKSGGIYFNLQETF